MAFTVTTENLNELYEDTMRCAQAVGLTYSSDEMTGFYRRRAGKGFTYYDDQQCRLDNTTRQRIEQLAIPPAWREVWICPQPEGHILATGVDDKGRKQYIYHPKWRKARDLLNFYKLILFGEELPAIRRAVKLSLKQQPLSRDEVLGLMIWTLDNAYIRVGNEAYYTENETVGLTTMTHDNVQVRGDQIIFSFVGKSHQEQHIELTDPARADNFRRLLKLPGERLFQTQDGTILTAMDCNTFLQSVTKIATSAKNFRTWGGTLAAFTYLKKYRASDEKAEKLVIQAVDEAAETLGNTRAVARKHYVHPHILAAFTEDTFDEYYAQIKPRPHRGLAKTEDELLQFLEILFNEQFDLLQVKQAQL